MSTEPVVQGVLEPKPVGNHNDQGSATTVSRADHLHDHGVHTTPLSHALANETAAGFMLPILFALGTTTRLVAGDSPYTVLATDHGIFCDTNGGAITVLLPAGVDGKAYYIINCGSSGNNVTLTPDGTELLYGFAASETMFDTEVFDIHYETTEGWR